MAEAAKLGYRPSHAEWCNLGQGQPETGPLPGAPPRVTAVAIDPADQDYAPVPGISEPGVSAEPYNQQIAVRTQIPVHRRRTCAFRAAAAGTHLRPSRAGPSIWATFSRTHGIRVSC
jgi:hypothetical protein